MGWEENCRTESCRISNRSRIFLFSQEGGAGKMNPEPGNEEESAGMLLTCSGLSWEQQILTKNQRIKQN